MPGPRIFLMYHNMNFGGCNHHSSVEETVSEGFKLEKERSRLCVFYCCVPVLEVYSTWSACVVNLTMPGGAQKTSQMKTLLGVVSECDCTGLSEQLVCCFGLS
ncbi:hypothetical protein AAY473_029507 [Plecturocebus cupreus]